MRLGRLGIAAALLAGGLVASGEEITLTTYYPSPRGVYDELRANRLILRDRITGRDYSVVMDEGRLLVVDVENNQGFILIELPKAE